MALSGLSTKKRGWVEEKEKNGDDDCSRADECEKPAPSALCFFFRGLVFKLLFEDLCQGAPATRRRRPSESEKRKRKKKEKKSSKKSMDSSTTTAVDRRVVSFLFSGLPPPARCCCCTRERDGALFVPLLPATKKNAAATPSPHARERGEKENRNLWRASERSLRPAKRRPSRSLFFFVSPPLLREREPPCLSPSLSLSLLPREGETEREQGLARARAAKLVTRVEN